MVKKVQNELFQNVNLSDITYNKKFWTTVSLHFSNKIKTNHKINLTEKYVLVTMDEKIAKSFKEYFDQTVPKLNIIQNECDIRKTGNIEDAVEKLYLSISIILV